MNETSSFQQPAYVQKTSNKKRLLIIFFIILLLLIIGLVGLYFLGGKTKQQSTPTKPIPTAEPSPTIVATPIASNSATITATPSAGTKLDRSTLQVSVQNGSGTVGVAQKIADTLKKAGYIKVTTGNADAYTYEGITIHVKKKYRDYLPVLQKDLATANPKVNIKPTVDDTIKTDAEVIVGHY
ncbi:MAG: LytR C-terminal domain-containing protein [Candidatus Levyibacteriota bacterium]